MQKDDVIYRQVAIDAMADVIWHYPNEKYAELNDYENARHLADCGLSQLPSAQPDFDTDRKINKAYDDGYDQGYLQCKANQEKITGHWIERRKKGSCYWQSWCSVCGKHSGIGGIESNRHKPFCPNCGSPMEGVVYDV